MPSSTELESLESVLADLTNQRQAAWDRYSNATSSGNSSRHGREYDRLTQQIQNIEQQLARVMGAEQSPIAPAPYSALPDASIASASAVSVFRISSIDRERQLVSLDDGRVFRVQLAIGSSMPEVGTSYWRIPSNWVERVPAQSPLPVDAGSSSPPPLVSAEYSWTVDGNITSSLLDSASSNNFAGLNTITYNSRDSAGRFIPFSIHETPPSPEEAAALQESQSQERKEKRMRTKKVIQQFMGSKGLRGAEGWVKCGLEFEFHKLHGPNSNIFDSRAFEYNFKIAEKKYTQNIYRLWGYARNRDLDYKSYKESWHYLDRFSPETIASVPAHFQSNMQEYITILQSRFREKWTQEHQRDYITAADSSDLKNWNRISPYTQLGTDGSVRGGEIRTRDGRTIREFLRASHVLSQNKFDVDVDTSFHIHLSVNGVDHAWGGRFQAEMYAYLLRNLDRLPKPIQERIVADRGGVKWAKFTIENGHKYSAIYQNEEFNTWEFRLFGNITRSRDMIKCLALALDTLRHAYAVKLGQRKSLLADYELDRIKYSLEAIYGIPKEGYGSDPDYDDNGDPVPQERSKGVGPFGFWKFLQKKSAVIRNIERDAA